MLETTLNPGFDEPKFRRQMKNLIPANRRYLIVFTPRSGSTWLTTVLMSTGVHGQPREYLNEEILGVMAQRLNASDHPSILEMLLRKRKTPNGVFGLRATSTHIRAFGEETLFEGLGLQTLVYLLWRENIVAQGISAYRAVETRKFHSYQDVAAGIPRYDGKKIRWWISHILEIENENSAMLSRRNVKPCIICYEQIVEDRANAVVAFSDVPPHDVPPATEDAPALADLSKVGDAWNDEAETRFRSGERRFIADVESRRLVRSFIAARG